VFKQSPERHNPELLSVGVLSLGCARNLVDSEVSVGALINAGYRYEPIVAESDIALVNTCGFIDEAKKESVQAIVELLDLKKKGRIRAVVVMGCLSQRYGAELERDLEGIDAILGVNDFERLATILEPLRQKVTVSNVTASPHYLLNRYSPRQSLTPKHTTYIKISEGCINACAYCAIPLIKGKHRSRTIEDIVGQVRDSVSNPGLSEINLIGQDIAAFGVDLEKKFMLPRLVREVAAAAPESWIRLLYAHPAHVTDELYDVFADHPNVCRYIDVPIEHSHPDVLKRMNRGSTRSQIDHVIESFRKRVPGIALRTALVVGFPGETDREFDDLLQYMRDIRFERLGAFIYSHEEGTRAYEHPDQVPEELKKERLDRVMILQREIIEDWHRKRIGDEMKVLIDDASSEFESFTARSEYDAPEVDTVVKLRSSQRLKPGDFVACRITGQDGYDLMAEVRDSN